MVPLRLEIGQRLLDLALQAHRLLVDDEDVRLEGLGRVADDRLAHLQRLVQVDMPVHRCVFAVAQLDDARDLHEIDAGAIVEGAGDRGARDDQDVEAAIILDQRMRDGAAAAEMAEAERVVAVHQDAGVFDRGGLILSGACLVSPSRCQCLAGVMHIRFHFTYRDRPHRASRRPGN